MAFLDALKESRRELIPDELKSSYDILNKAISSQQPAKSSGSGNQLSVDEMKEQARKQVREELSPFNKFNRSIKEAKSKELADTPSILDIEKEREDVTEEPEEEDNYQAPLTPSIGAARTGFESVIGRPSAPTQAIDQLSTMVDRTDNNSFDQGKINELNDYINNQIDTYGTPEYKDEFDRYVRTQIDNGTPDREAYEAPDMTGSQYKMYQRVFGLGGRPEEEISDTEIYNKAKESINYGFQPILLNQNQINRSLLNAPTQILTDFTNGLASLREDNRGDYYINNIQQSNGETIDSINGDQFDSMISDYSNDIAARQLNNEDYVNSNLLGRDQITEDIINDPNYAKSSIVGWTMDFGDGNEETYDGAYTYVIDKNDEDLLLQTGDVENIPVTIGLVDRNGMQVTNQNGEPASITFENYNELTDALENGLFRSNMQITEDPTIDNVDYAFPVDPLIMEDGTTIPYQTTVGIERGNIGTPDYGFLGMNRPASKVNDFISFDDDTGQVSFDFSLDNLVPAMTDIGLSSAPYMAPLPIMAPLMGANVMQGLKGIDSMSGNTQTDSYQQVAEDLTPERYFSNLAGEIAIPVSEHMMGVGAGAGKNLFAKTFAPQLLNRSSSLTAAPILKLGKQAVGEGMEEVFQNPIEEIKRYGISGAYQLPETDENTGITNYDNTGHEIRRTDTDPLTRFGNFATSVPNDFIAGGLMGGTLGGLLGGRRAISETRDRYKRNKEDKERGLPRWKDVTQEVEPMSDEEWADLFRREGLL